ncbi:hypothetical protein CJ030_MR8G020199 [Morella rubra]|uniref:Uncharacterized protein n=1 Tax=Morella rubra TaxID=262757 RepID=A0A6A1UQ18_9ROSI|nr:hypothetical protein CJ030_MR8G020199 [Morella rubra]
MVLLGYQTGLMVWRKRAWLGNLIPPLPRFAFNMGDEEETCNGNGTECTSLKNEAGTNGFVNGIGNDAGDVALVEVRVFELTRGASM